MLDKEIAAKVLEESLALGADFADIFVEKNEQQIIKFFSNRVEENQSGVDFGIGLRLIYGQNSVYAYTNIAELDELIRLTRLLSKVHKGEEKPFTGMAFYFYKEGLNSQESPYIKGKLNGTEVNYYESGSIHGETPYVDGKKHGTQIWYFEDGSKKEEFVYENGKQISRKKF